VEVATIAARVARRLFQVEEANALVPLLQRLIERLQRAALRLDEERRNLAREEGIDVAALEPERLLRRRRAARAAVEELETVVEEIEATGVQLKDVQLGLVDFPSEREGEVVLLCWQFGEPEVAFWHRVDEGFAGRRALPGAEGPRYLQ
jgi:hypothetical protein